MAGRDRDRVVPLGDMLSKHLLPSHSLAHSPTLAAPLHSEVGQSPALLCSQPRCSALSPEHVLCVHVPLHHVPCLSSQLATYRSSGRSLDCAPPQAALLSPAWSRGQAIETVADKDVAVDTQSAPHCRPCGKCMSMQFRPMIVARRRSLVMLCGLSVFCTWGFGQ